MGIVKNKKGGKMRGTCYPRLHTNHLDGENLRGACRSRADLRGSAPPNGGAGAAASLRPAPFSIVALVDGRRGLGLCPSAWGTRFGGSLAGSFVMGSFGGSFDAGSCAGAFAGCWRAPENGGDGGGVRVSRAISTC